MSEELQTTGWQIPEKSGWTLFVGLLPTFESGVGRAVNRPWLYMTKDGHEGPLYLAKFHDVARAKIVITFINAMHDQINAAILHALTEKERNEPETPSKEGTGQEDGPEHKS